MSLNYKTNCFPFLYQTAKKRFFPENPLSFSWNVWYNRYKRYVRVGKETSVMESNALLNAKLSLDSDISLYAQLVGIIKRNISTGVLAVGDLLPSEAELCRAEAAKHLTKVEIRGL